MLRWGRITTLIGSLLVIGGILPARQAEVESFVNAANTESNVLNYTSLVALLLGALFVLVGALIICVKERSTRLMLAGITLWAVLLMMSRVFLFMNVHSWTALLGGVWFFGAFIALVFILVGLIRYLVGRSRTPTGAA